MPQPTAALFALTLAVGLLFLKSKQPLKPDGKKSRVPKADKSKIAAANQKKREEKKKIKKAAKAAAAKGFKRGTYQGKNTHHGVANPCRIVVCENEFEYRKAVEYVQASDTVLEVGCHEGVTTNMIAPRCARIHGVDKSEYSIDLAKQRFPSEDGKLTFQVLDAEDVSGLIQTQLKFTAIFLDISGSRELRTLIPIMEKYLAAIKPRMFVIKAFRLSLMLSQCEMMEVDNNTPSIA